MKAGQKFGKYRLLERLAHGGMAEVYLAQVEGEAGFSKSVVIKRLLGRFRGDTEFGHMMVDEARITAQLTHSNICQVLDLGSLDGAYFLAMEHIAGEDLRALRDVFVRRREYLPTEASIYIICEMLAGLHYAHEKEGSDGRPLSIVHRDVSPQNVLISYEGAVKVIDFGIAKARERMVQTQAGVIKGKFRYMSPEQAFGADLDRRTDVFAAGVVLYELLRGEAHLAKVPDTEVLIRMREANFEPLTQRRKDLPRGLSAIVHKALARQPDLRFSTAEDFRKALEENQRARGASYARGELASLMRRSFSAERRRARGGSARQSLTASQAEAAVGSAGRTGTFWLESGLETDPPPPGPMSADGTATGAAAVVPPPTASSSSASTAGARQSPGRRVEPPADTDPLGTGDVQFESQAARQPIARALQGRWPRRSRPARPRQAASRPPKITAEVAPTVVEPLNVVDGGDQAAWQTRPDPAAPPEARRSLLSQLVTLLMVAGVLALGALVAKHMGLLAWEADSDGAALSSGARDASLSGLDARPLRDAGEGQLRVVTRPPGAWVIACGQELAEQTPVVVTLQAQQRCALEIAKPGYRPAHRTVFLRRGERSTLRLRLRRRKGRRKRREITRPVADTIDARLARPAQGTLSVTSIESGTVFLNGQRVGSTPGLRLSLRPGRYRVQVVFSGSGRQTVRDIRVVAGQRIALHLSDGS